MVAAGLPRLLFVALLGATVGCASPSIVPASLQLQVDRTLTFARLKESPDSYRGRLILVGGEVLSAKRLKDGTRVEILQIPLEESQAPGTDRMTSEGRLLAIQKEFLDPATIPPGTRVTIVGEVAGAMTLPLDETDYTYPTLEIKHLKVWPMRDNQASRPGSYSGPAWHPFYGPWYRSPYWR
ncbi:MAG: Slp family lipoprotein [Nitrospirota bacterium]|nr:Slp family lipoprotein [Nitrospirota bacterium]